MKLAQELTHFLPVLAGDLLHAVHPVDGQLPVESRIRNGRIADAGKPNGFGWFRTRRRTLPTDRRRRRHRRRHRFVVSLTEDGTEFFDNIVLKETKGTS